MLPFRARGQRGITLIEIMLYCAIIAAAAAAIFVFSKKASVTAAVEKEQRQIESVVKTVDGLFATQPNFAALGTNGANYLKERAARSGLKLTTNAAGTANLETGLGDGLLNLAVWDVVPDTGPAVPNSGYRLAYQGLAAGECTSFITATLPIAYQVGVAHDALNDASATILAKRGQLVVGREKVAEVCAASSPSVFLYFAPARAIAGATAPTAPPAARCAPVHETQQATCPAGQVGTITQERDGTCTGPGNTMVYTVWTMTDSTCAAAPTAPSTVVPPTAPDICTVTTFTNVVACPLGQTGQTIQTRDLDSCAGTYTPWTTQSTSCQSTSGPTTCTPSTQDQQLACSAGMTGEIRQSRSSNCTTPTAAPVWSAWQTYSNTCRGTATCQPQRETTPVPCAAGQYGAWFGERERFRTCVNATTQGAWSAWSVLTPNSSCSSCPADSTETTVQWVIDSTSCPTGETGVHEWEAEQVSTRTVSYNCPEGTTALPTPTTSAWSGWTSTGATRNVVNTCSPASCTGNPSESQWLATSAACLAGETGTNTWEYEQTRSRTCNAGTWTAWSGWTSTGATRNVVNTCAASTGMCAAPSSFLTGTQNGGDGAYGISYTLSASPGGGNFTCYERDGCTIASVTAAALTLSQWGDLCQTGDVYTIYDNPFGYGYTDLVETSTYEYTCEPVSAGNCQSPTSCSGNPSESKWLGTSAACPVGQTGTHTWEYEQMRSRTCNAGTWTAWSGWTNTSATRNVVNTCAGPSCAPPIGQPGGPVLKWFIACAANTGAGSGTPPDFAALKAASPANTTRYFYNFGESIPYGNYGYNCVTSNGTAAWANPQIDGSRSEYAHTFAFVYAEVDWNGTTWTGWTGEHTSSADGCELRGDSVEMGQCVEGYGGAMPPGIVMGQLVNTPSTVHAYMGSYTCP